MASRSNCHVLPNFVAGASFETYARNVDCVKRELDFLAGDDAAADKGLARCGQLSQQLSYVIMATTIGCAM